MAAIVYPPLDPRTRAAILRRTVKPSYAPIKPAAKPRLAKPVSPYAPMSEQDIQAEAARRTQAQLGPQQDQSKQRTAQALAAIAGAGKAAAEMLKGLAPATQQAYDLAGQETAAIGEGYTGQMKDAIGVDRAKAAEFAASQGAPAPAPTTSLEGLQNAVYHGGVGIPGSALEAQGAAATAANEGLVGASALQTQSDIRVRQASGEQELLDLASKEPDLRNQVLDELYKREMDKLQARLSISDAKEKKREFNAQESVQERAQSLYERQFGETVRSNKADESLAAGRIYVDQQNLQLKSSKQKADVQKAINDGKKVNASASRGLGYLVDQYGNPVLDSNHRKIKVSQTTGGSGSSGSPYQKAVTQASTMRGKPVANTAIDPATGDPLPGKYLAKPSAKGVYNQPGTPRRTDDPKKALTDGTKNFAEAQSYLMDAYGLSRAQARRALISAGWKPDGQRPKKK